MNGLDHFLANLLKHMGINPDALKKEIETRLSQFEGTVTSLDENLKQINARLDNIERHLMRDVIAPDSDLETDPELVPVKLPTIGAIENGGKKRKQIETKRGN